MTAAQPDEPRSALGRSVQGVASLHCPVCGNGELFVQKIRDESNLVTKDGTYIRLLHSQIDHYMCYFCGERISFV